MSTHYDANDTSPSPPSSPSADEVKQLVRSQNIRFGLGMLALLLLSVVTAFFAGDSRAASRDSNNATKASLASNARDACITGRRSEQFAALGRISIHANEAEVAGLVNDDPVEARRQLQLFHEAVAEWTAATLSLSPEVLNQPTPEGCGAPILTTGDLKD